MLPGVESFNAVGDAFGVPVGLVVAEAIAGAPWVSRLYRSRKLEGWYGDNLWPLDLAENPIGSAGRAALEAVVKHGLRPKANT